MEILPPLDREQVWLLFASFSGDITKTAHAAGVRSIDILRAADDGKWLERLRPILDLKKSANEGDVERSINRAISLCQATRMRMLLDRTISRINTMTDDEFDDLLLPENKNGFRTLTTRHLCDLASACEKTAAQAAAALGDTAQDRARRNESDDGKESLGKLHGSIAAAMAAISKDATPRAVLLDAQLIQADQIAKTLTKPAPPENPADRDDPPLEA